MRKLLLLPALFGAMILYSCGNDPAVESSYVNAMEKCIKQLKRTNDMDELVCAQDLLDSAKSIPGVLDLSRSKTVKDVEERCSLALDEAQNRIFSKLLSEGTDTVMP